MHICRFMLPLITGWALFVGMMQNLLCKSSVSEGGRYSLFLANFPVVAGFLALWM